MLTYALWASATLAGTGPDFEVIGARAVDPTADGFALWPATAVPDPRPIAESGVGVGHVLFSGGYETVDGPLGQQNVSVQSQLVGTEGRWPTLAAWLGDAAPRILRHLGEAAPSTPSGALPPPVGTTRRGTYAAMGSDNAPLPRLAWTPIDGGADAPRGRVVVPWVLAGLTHNAGWFLGQTHGSSAGARLRVLFAVYDDGKVVGYVDCDARVIESELFSPNSVEIDELQLSVERRFARKCEFPKR